MAKATITLWLDADDLKALQGVSDDPEPRVITFCNEAKRVECGIMAKDGADLLCDGCSKITLTIKEGK